MVVLSACETGLGDARNGEGVYGLRRALVLAGSESQMLSLWKVPDEATRDLMIAYYEGLRAGEGRANSLRSVQLAVLRNRDRVHPFYWASFILSGDWRQMFPMN
jgi:CHAT domain-containing protein